MIEINLCSIPFLNTSYANVIDFENSYSRHEWFKSKTLLKVSTNIKYDNNRSYIVLNKNFNDLKMYDYLWYEKNNRSYYYFILSHEMVTENTTKLYIDLDIFTSYMFSYTFLPSFIDRCHVPRWNGDIPTYNMEEEDIGIFDYTITEKEDIYTMGNGVVVSTSSPIGKLHMINTSYDNSIGIGNGGYGSIENNTMSKNGFIFLKQVEGFVQTPIYLENLYSLGYGITEKYQNARYKKLYPSCTEREASEVLDDLMRNEFCLGVTQMLQDLGIELDTYPIHQYDVWCSLAMNYGLNGLEKTSAWQYFKNNINDVEGVANKIKSLSSYPSRRALEYEIYLNGKYPSIEDKPINKYEGNTITGNIDGVGYIPSHYQTSSSGSTSQQQSIVNSARKLIGKPYRWGGNYPPLGSSDGTDCSGLCQWAYNDNGFGGLIPGRWTTSTISPSGKEVTESDIQLADLILTPGHVVMYSGMKNGKHYIVEAPGTGKNIREREYTFTDRITTIRRLL